MRDFIVKAADRIEKLDTQQIHRLVFDLMEDIELLEMVLSSLDRGIVVMDNENQILLVNRHIRRYLPLKSGSPLEGIAWEQVEDPSIAQFLEQVLQSQDNIREKEFALDFQGRTMILSLSVLPLVKDGRVKGNLLVAENITQRKAEESRLRRAESLISLTTLTAGIAHEIKNPLGSMAIYLQLMQKVLNKQCGKCNNELLGYLEIIEEEVERLNSIVVDYLFAVKPLDTTLSPSSINRVVEELAEFVHVELDEKSIELEMNLAEDIPCLALDDKLMKQVLLNLVKNAEGAMETGGKISLETHRDGDSVRLVVRDNGQGIADEQLTKIFEPYFTTKDNGTGLGLTLVYKIIKEHGGDIEVQSKLHQGSSFIIYLPIPQKEQRLLTWEEDHEL